MHVDIDQHFRRGNTIVLRLRGARRLSWRCTIFAWMVGLAARVTGLRAKCDIEPNEEST